MIKSMTSSCSSSTRGPVLWRHGEHAAVISRHHGIVVVTVFIFFKPATHDGNVPPPTRLW